VNYETLQRASQRRQCVAGVSIPAFLAIVIITIWWKKACAQYQQDVPVVALLRMMDDSNLEVNGQWNSGYGAITIAGVLFVDCAKLGIASLLGLQESARYVDDFLFGVVGEFKQSRAPTVSSDNPSGDEDNRSR
jgi:hypothetical protein